MTSSPNIGYNTIMLEWQQLNCHGILNHKGHIMKANEIKVGGLYRAKVGVNITTVRVDAIRNTSGMGLGMGGSGIRYDVTNMVTGRRTTFRSAAKFRCEAKPAAEVDRYQGLKDGTIKPESLTEECIAAGTEWAPKPGEAESFTLDEDGNEVAEAEAEPKPLTVNQTQQMFDATDRAAALGYKEAEQRSDPTLTTATVADMTTQKDQFAKCAAGIVTQLECAQVAAPATSTFPMAAFDQVAAVAKPMTRKHPLTSEQQAIVDTAPNVQVLVIEAGAGAGKTSTLVEVANELGGLGQYTAFNTSLVAESKSKLPSHCSCNTIHSLAFRSEGRKFSHRLNKGRTRSSEVAAALGIADMTVVGIDGKEKRLDAGYLASCVTRAVKAFCQSADREVSLHHFGTMNGVAADSEATITYSLLPYARAMWQDCSNPAGRLPFAHDHYVKVWQLNNPVISTDYVLLDEAQDTSPVMLDVLAQQAKRGTRVILVGDSAQQIYSWRGAVNALAAFPSAKRLMLSQSFRFGPVIAEVANAILSHLGNRTPLVMRGFDKVASRLASLSNPQAVLCRTNAAAVQTVLTAIADGKRPHLIGGGDEVLKFVNAARDLQRGQRTQHPELACFESWGEVKEFAGSEEGEDIKLMVKLVDQFGADKIAGALKNMPTEANADLVVSTAHKSKGREWDSVRLASDFMPLSKMGDEELRLLYVAATRAKRVLDVETCPPFRGQSNSEDGDDTPKRNHSVDLTEARRLSKLVGQLEPEATEQPVPTQQPTTPQERPQYNTEQNTWTKSRQGEWCVRGKPGQSGLVEVVRRNGSKSKEKLGKVIWQDAAVALYQVVGK